MEQLALSGADIPTNGASQQTGGECTCEEHRQPSRDTEPESLTKHEVEIHWIKPSGSAGAVNLNGNRQRCSSAGPGAAEFATQRNKRFFPRLP